MATAQTVDQWYAKIKKWVPGWWFQNINNLPVFVVEAIFYGAAAVYQQAEQDMLDQQEATYITQNPQAPIIDLLGFERSFPRTENESNANYAIGVQNALFRNVGGAQLEALVNNQLFAPPGFFIENEQYGFFDDADVTETPGIPYFDDYWTRWLRREKTYNWWTVIIPLQTGGDDATIMTNLISTIEANKALGTTYDVLYEDASDTDTDD